MSNEQIRKFWLIALLCNFFFPILWLLLFIPVFNIYIVSRIFGITIVTSLIFWLYYHFAYKNYGTKFLTFFLIVSPLGKLSSLYKALHNQHLSPQLILPLILEFLFFLCLYLLSLKLRKINKLHNTPSQA